MENEAYLLRKLTFKSKLKFGKYSDLTVQDVINLNAKGYLIWVYYNCSMITFIDEILDYLNIQEDKRIKKPGIDLKLHEENIKNYSENLNGLSKIIIKNRTNAIKKSKIKALSQKEKLITRKVLQAKNHGKK